jgi:hypothetical protein
VAVVIPVKIAFGLGHRLRALDKDHCIATWDLVLLQIWRLGTSFAAVKNLSEIARSFIEERKGARISSLAIIESTATPPADAVRGALSKFYRELGPEMRAAIVVAEGGGFRAAFVRGVGITLSRLAPRSLPFQFVGSVSEATQLLGPNLSPLAGGAESLQRVIQGVRAQVP